MSWQVNTAFNDEDQRYHSGNTPWTGGGDSYYEGSPIYGEQIPSDSEYYLTHPIRSTGSLWKYSETSLSRDIRLSYTHPDYPWLIAIHRYDHNDESPHDYDYVSLTIDQPPGHYVVAWSWHGYYDCTDVDVFDYEVANIYGVDSGAHVWNRIDHCQYQRRKNTLVGVFEAIDGAAHCRDLLPSWGVGGTTRYGIQVLPLRNSAPVYEGYQDFINIPWGDYEAGSASEFTLVPGEFTDNIDWVAWKAVSTLADNVGCANLGWTETITLKQAILKCSSEECFGLQWTPSVWQEGFPSGTYETQVFSSCTSSTTISQEAARLFGRIFLRLLRMLK